MCKKCGHPNLRHFAKRAATQARAPKALPTSRVARAKQRLKRTKEKNEAAAGRARQKRAKAIVKKRPKPVEVKEQQPPRQPARKSRKYLTANEAAPNKKRATTTGSYARIPKAPSQITDAMNAPPKRRGRPPKRQLEKIEMKPQEYQFNQSLNH
jgi:hypothetical protein